MATRPRPWGRPASATAAIGSAVALGLAACGADAPPPAIAGGAPASDVCGPLERPTLQAGSHLIGDTEPPVPYTSVPPSSGWHRSGMPTRGVQRDPLTGPQLVSALEAGDVVVAWDPQRVPEQTVARIEDLATSTFDGRLTTTPHVGMEAPITFVGWGVLRPCEELDEVALAAFVLAWFGAVDAHG